MMMLSLKSVAWDESRKGFFSPQQTGFFWPSGAVVAAQCEHITELGDVSENCHCGIYSSPNTNILTEYEVYPNSIIVMLNLYGKYRIYKGPSDKAGSFVLRSWGAKVVGIAEESPKNMQRYMTTVLAAQFFCVPIQKLSEIEMMVRLNWENKKIPFQPLGGNNARI